MIRKKIKKKLKPIHKYENKFFDFSKKKNIKFVLIITRKLDESALFENFDRFISKRLIKYFILLERKLL